MLLFGLDIPLWVALGAITISLLYWYGTSTYGVFKKMGVPSLTPLPLVGNILTLMSMPLHEFDLLLRKKLPGKLYGCFQGRTSVLGVADINMIKEITIKDFSSFANRRDFLDETSLFTSNVAGIKDAHWKHVRATLSPTFTSGKLKLMYPQINICADKLVAHVMSQPSGPVEIKKFIDGYTMDVIASAAFGLEIDAQSSTEHAFIRHAKAFFGIPVHRSQLKQAFIFFCIFLLPAPVRKFIGLFTEMSFVDPASLKYFEDITDQIFSQTQSQRSDRKNFISICAENLVDVNSSDVETLTSSDGLVWSTKGLTRYDIIANSFIFFTAGYETTASSLQFFFYNMALHPDVQEKLYNVICEVQPEEGDITYEQLKKIDYLNWCIDESMRLYPPIPRVDRVANNDATINGVHIPKGMVIDFLIYLIHHDPEYWPEPEKYDPERFDPENMTETQKSAFVPFGSGSRLCIASRLAMLEVRVAAFKMMKAFRFEKTAETPEKEEMKFAVGVGVMAPAAPLKISAIPRA